MNETIEPKGTGTMHDDFGWLTSRSLVLKHVTEVLTRARNDASTESTTSEIDEVLDANADPKEKRIRWLRESLADVDARSHELFHVIDPQADEEVVRKAVHVAMTTTPFAARAPAGPRVALPPDDAGRIKKLDIVIAAQEKARDAVQKLQMYVSETMWNGGFPIADQAILDIQESVWGLAAGEDAQTYELKLCAVALRLAQHLPDDDVEDAGAVRPAPLADSAPPAASASDVAGVPAEGV